MIQQNLDRSTVFNRSWAEFKVGFNDSRGNYWLGNDLLSQLTRRVRYKLKFDVQSRNNSNWYYAEYSSFIVQPESSNYRLEVSGYSGNTGYDALGYQNGMKFTTFDRDNDQSSVNCAASRGGGFWYKLLLLVLCEQLHRLHLGYPEQSVWRQLPAVISYVAAV